MNVLIDILLWKELLYVLSVIINVMVVYILQKTVPVILKYRLKF